MRPFAFRPKLISSLREYSRRTFAADLMAGIIVGIVALPLAIAFGIASGVSPEKGIITAVIAGFVVSLLGGSRVQIGGPTGAFIVIVYGIIQQYGEAGLLVATLMAGVLLVLMGLFRLGTVIKFIPYPIVVGFTAGIALTIFTTQIPDLLGLDFGGEAVPGDFIGKWGLYVRHAASVDPLNALVGVLSILADRRHAAFRAPHPRLSGSHRAAHGRGLAAPALCRYRRDRHHRRPFHHPRGAARRIPARDRLAGRAQPAARRLHHRRTGGHRIAPLGHRSRRRDR